MIKCILILVISCGYDYSGRLSLDPLVILLLLYMNVIIVITAIDLFSIDSFAALSIVLQVILGCSNWDVPAFKLGVVY